MVGAFSLLSFFPPQKKFSLLFFSLSLFTAEKASEEKKKKVRLKSIRRRRKNRRRREILVAFTVESFYLLAFRILSSSLKCCCVGFFCRRVLISVAFSRARHIIGGGLLREEKGGLRFFLLGLWVRVKNVVGVLVADANAWMQILNFKCVRRVRLPAKEGLNCSSSRLAVMMLARDFFSSRACDKDLSLTTLLLFSLLFHSYTKQQAERKQTHTYT